MSKEARRQAALAAAKANQKKPSPPTPPVVTPAAATPLPSAPIVPTPPTQEEIDASAQRDLDASDQSVREAAKPYEAAPIPGKPITRDDLTDAPAAIRTGLEVDNDRRLEQGKPPLLSTAAVEDLPPQSGEQQAEEQRLLDQALAAEAAGNAAPVASKSAPDQTILIHNTTTSLHGLTLPLKAGEKTNRATLRQIQLLPGVNPVPLAAWRECLKQKMVQIHLNEGMYVELDAAALWMMNERKALEVVDLTVHKPLLLEWLEKENHERKRPRVYQAIQAQLEKIAPTKPKKGDDEDEDADQE